MSKKRAQVTIFIIVAILIISGTILFFMFRESLGLVQIPPSMEPVYNTFLTCIEEEASVGINVLETQGGYISLPDFEPGSAYMPFSSQLGFLGNAIPYWYYVSGNNIPKEQVPSKGEMQRQLEEFLEDEIRDCNFEQYYDDGFEITLGEPDVNVDINGNDVGVLVNMFMGIERAEENVVVRKHDVEINSELGDLYDSAREVFDYEQETLFLENYGVDTLRLYAPVDGVELSCSPVIWNAEEVFDDLEEGFESNVQALNVIEDENEYFELDLPVSHDVRFLNSRKWSNGFEVEPSETGILIANTVGNQPGLGALGFCYAPYHFVYNVRYPVLVQISGEEETFQFPMAVVIEGNKPREALNVSTVAIEGPPVCEQQNTPVGVNVYDTNLNPVDAEISYKCSETVCRIGETEAGFIEEDFPQCINGFIIARAEGYKEKRELYTVLSQGTANIILDRLYETEVDLKLDNLDYDGRALITFTSEDDSKTIVYPEQTSVELSEGQYEIQTYIYRNSSIRIGSTTIRECVDVPESGIGGFLGFTKENCYNIDFPEQIISNALAGGGKQNYYILESELKNSNNLEIRAGSLPKPTTLQQLQDNYVLFENKNLAVSLT